MPLEETHEVPREAWGLQGAGEPPWGPVSWSLCSCPWGSQGHLASLSQCLDRSCTGQGGDEGEGEVRGPKPLGHLVLSEKAPLWEGSGRRAGEAGRLVETWVLAPFCSWGGVGPTQGRQAEAERGCP